MKTQLRPLLTGLTLCAALGALPKIVSAQIYVPTAGGGRIAEYNLDGTTVNASLVSGLNNPFDLTVSGGNIFVANTANGAPGQGTIGEYTTSGAVVNASLISGLNTPVDVAVSGGLIFLLNNANGTIGEYTMSGTAINASLITGLNNPIIDFCIIQ